MGTGRFVEEEVVLIRVEASDILVAHSAVAETDAHDLRFESGERLRVRARIQITLERMAFKEGDDDDRAILEAYTHGKVEFLDESGVVLFDARWKGHAEETRVTLYGDRVEHFEAQIRYSGAGTGPCQGRKVSGVIRCVMTGKDLSGMEVFKVTGEGEVSA